MAQLIHFWGQKREKTTFTKVRIVYTRVLEIPDTQQYSHKIRTHKVGTQEFLKWNNPSAAWIPTAQLSIRDVNTKYQSAHDNGSPEKTSQNKTMLSDRTKWEGFWECPKRVHDYNFSHLTWNGHWQWYSLFGFRLAMISIYIFWMM